MAKRGRFKANTEREAIGGGPRRGTERGEDDEGVGGWLIFKLGYWGGRGNVYMVMSFISRTRG